MRIALAPVLNNKDSLLVLNQYGVEGGNKKCAVSSSEWFSAVGCRHVVNSSDLPTLCQPKEIDLNDKSFSGPAPGSPVNDYI